MQSKQSYHTNSAETKLPSIEYSKSQNQLFIDSQNM